MIKKIVAVSLAVIAMTAAAMGATQPWGVDITQARHSDGRPLTHGLTFRLGTFTLGFTPTFTNAPDWAANWVTVGIVGGTADWGSWAEFGGEWAHWGSVGTSSVVRPGGPPAGVVGQRGYIWAYEHLNIPTFPDWILLTNPAWIFPAGTAVGEIAMPVESWATSTAGTVAIVGSINHGPGVAEFSMQMQAIPEPSTYALIFGLAILGFLGYRRFRKQA